MSAISVAMVKELRERTGLGMMECRKALVAVDGNIEKAIEELRKKSGVKAAKKADRVAAEGVVATKIANDGSYAVLVEINSETDFATRDPSFLDFVRLVTDTALILKSTDIDSLMTTELDVARQALVQKIGENINIRRLEVLQAEVLGAYVHTNARIAVLVGLQGGNTQLAKEVAMHIAAINPRVISRDDMPEAELEKEKEIIKAQPDMAGKPVTIVDKMVLGRINKFLAENSLLEQPFVKNPDMTVDDLLKQSGAAISTFTRFAVGEGIVVEKKDFAEEVAAQLGQ